MAEVVELHKLKLAELKQECTARGLDAKGNKADLIARLQAYLEEHEEVNEEEVLEEYVEEAFAKEETDSQKQEFTPPEEETEKKLVKINPPATVGERLQKRAERFNIPPSADTKKAARAARFGLQEPEAVSSKGTSAKINIEDDEKLKKRKERFGIVTSAASSGANDTEETD
ncbi:hypothetical protein cypCar_00036549 [Cyprinus carpio]|nr:hypothetical protein cypCar_00036549 [Cyprinus carpio]